MSDERERDEEDHLREVDRVLLYIAEARLKAQRSADELAAEGAEERFVSALRSSEAAMAAEHKRLMNSTFYSIPNEQESLNVGESRRE